MSDPAIPTGQPARRAPETRIVAGFRPGAIGRIVEMHARFYGRFAGFGRYFEARVAAELAGFANRLDNPRNELWLALVDQTTVGSIAIDGEDLGNGVAHLRWFIMDDDARGAGAGGRLLREALAFCDQSGFAETRLWTFDGLKAARKLYEAHGFALVEELPGRQWGSEVLEQTFARPGRS